MKKIKLIISDFDGVLLDLKDLHFESLNMALSTVDNKFIISKEDHIKYFDGLSTKSKLKILCEKNNFPKDKINFINDLKQEYTLSLLRNYKNYNKDIVNTIKRLKSEGYIFYIASNAVKQTIITGCIILGIFDLIDGIYSNEDVINQKPNPEIYMRCMLDALASPEETLILEDSKTGREGAIKSGANLCGLDDSFDFTYDKIKSSIVSYENQNKKIKWLDKKMNVLIPMAGLGSRFSKEGYTLPKPLINVNGKPMIQLVVENLNIDAHFIFVVQKEHVEKYNLSTLLNLISPNCDIVITEGLTEGTACTTLLAKDIINNDNHLLIANCDQYVDWDSNDFMQTMLYHKVDGGILTFTDEEKSSKWSFAKVNEEGFVTEVAEKKPISDKATVGIYYFNKGNEYVKYCQNMINKNIRINNEFYVCPVYNEYINDNKSIKIKDCDRMWGIGVPKDLEFFLKNNKNK